MAAPTFYIETSVWGRLAPRQPADRKRIVRQLLRLLDGERGVCVISSAVLREIMEAHTSVVSAIQPHVYEVRPIIHEVTDAVKALAQAYLAAEVVPARRETDALHIAAATCFRVDYLVSWNHRHITRPSKRLQFQALNQLNGYPMTPSICNPVEAGHELRDR